MQNAPKIILGIDPGTVIMGYGLVSVSGSKLSVLDMGILKLGVKDDAYVRLQKIHARIGEIITQHQPHYFAIEAPFFGKNVQSMLKLGRAQGVAIAVAMSHGLTVQEYSPRKIKQAVTGNGNAGKDQVLKMLQTLLAFTTQPETFDATDALAVAVCHHFQMRSPAGAAVGKTNNWAEFVKKNPTRLQGKTS